jgi:DNA-binding transcriptional ArsR family regulator
MIDPSFVFKIKADFLKALSHPARLKIIEHLKRGEKSVNEMGKALEMEQSGLSKHLAILKQAGILNSRQQKVTVYYSVRDKGIYDVLKPVSLFLKKKLKESQEVLDHLAKE